MPDADVQRFYRAHARIYDHTRWLFLRRRERAVAALGLRPDSQVLEVGCGTGLNFRRILTRLSPRAGRLTGLDFSPQMLQRARQRAAAGRWDNVELVRADAATMELPHRFDAALFSYSLSMMPKLPAVLDQTSRHLVEGGRLVVLDFGRFEGWGPLGVAARAWLRLHHVHTDRPYERELRRVFIEVEVHRQLGGYCFLATCRRR